MAAPITPPIIMATATPAALRGGTCPASTHRDIAATTTATKLMARFKGIAERRG
jgi:hypothetical protein